MALIDDYISWRKSPAVGCMFARTIASGRARFKQGFEEFATQGATPEIAAALEQRVADIVASGELEAIAFIFPNIKSLERTTEIFLALGEQPNWTVTAISLNHPTAGDLVAIKMARMIPFQNGECPSEALILGPFDIFPPTRRSPAVALEMYVGAPREHDPKTGMPTEKANLAHMEMNLATPEQFEKMWIKSQEGRLTSLGGVEDGRAKAKVAFVIPVALAEKLGLAI